jgi:hypothetical protein
LVVVGYQPNGTAAAILRLCLDSIRRHTPEPHELWVVDNHSPAHFAGWLEEEPDLNVIFNLDSPFPKPNWRQRLLQRGQAPFVGSYANAVALELAAQVIDPDSEVMMTLHMDTMACRTGWLGYLCSKLQEQVRCVGFRLDTARVETVHVLGMLFDFRLFTPLQMTFAHGMPKYDVGDAISIRLREAGFRLWACRNTLHHPELVNLLQEGSEYRNLYVDRALDDEDNVIFMHLGRGILKSHFSTPEMRTTTEEWLRFGHEVVLGPSTMR